MLFKTHRIAPQFSPDSGPRAIPGHHHDPGRRRFIGLNNLNDLDRPIHHKHSPSTTGSTSFTQNTATPMQHNSSRLEYETNTVTVATNQSMHEHLSRTGSRHHARAPRIFSPGMATSISIFYAVSGFGPTLNERRRR